MGFLLPRVTCPSYGSIERECHTLGTPRRGCREVTLRNEWRVAGQSRGEATANRPPQRCETAVTGGDSR